MKDKAVIVLFGLTEILIGAVTLIAVFLILALGKSAKPAAVLVFVLITSVISLGLGAGILRHSQTCYHLLLFFATVIIFSKILIFAKIITLSGALETTISPYLKNGISIAYHSLLIFYFTRKPIREEFGERRKVFFSIRIPFLK